MGIVLRKHTEHMKSEPTNPLAETRQVFYVRFGKFWQRAAFRWWLAAALMAAGFSTLADNAIDLKDQTATFTNRQGRVYENVQLKRATADGLIYCDTTSSAMGRRPPGGKARGPCTPSRHSA